MDKFLKFFLELGPLLVFFFLNSQEDISVWLGEYFFGDTLKPIIVATGGFVIATIISLIATYIMLKNLPVMPLVSGFFIIIMGGLTIYLNDDTFIKIKPTIVNMLFGTVLLIGLKFNKVFLKLILEEGVDLTDIGWRGLTVRWGLFFYFLALINEIAWRCFTTDQWVTFKVWGVMPLTVIFVVFQIKFIMKHLKPEATENQ
jgi:intracellular septation protein